MAKQTFTTGQVLTAAQQNSLQANDFNQTVSVKTANYSLLAADKGTRIEFNTSGSVTCTVNSGEFDAGDTLIIQNRGAGTATITAGTATVNTSASLALSQYSAGTLYFVSDSAALFFGDAAGISASLIDAKGDLIVGTADNTVARLAVGTNGHTLVADSSTSTGLAYQGFIGAFCRKNASQTLTTSTLGAITWQTEIFDTNNIHSTVTDTDRFTIPTGLGGYWLISASITFDANTSGGRRLYLFKNGSGGTSIATLRTGAYTSDYLNLQCTAIVSCVAGDYLTISGWQSSGGNLAVWGDNLGNDVSWISVAYLGA